MRETAINCGENNLNRVEFERGLTVPVRDQLVPLSVRLPLFISKSPKKATIILLAT